MVDDAALDDALASGHLRGDAGNLWVKAGSSDWPALQLPNVTLTPHIALR